MADRLRTYRLHIFIKESDMQLGMRKEMISAFVAKSF